MRTNRSICGRVKQRASTLILLAMLVANCGYSCLATAATAAAAQNSASGSCPPARDQPLSFWFGRWEAFADGKLDGRSLIENILDGCAVVEHWHDVSGFEGQSLFYFEPHLQQWKQVWITDHALAPGGLKEKVLVYASEEMVRFQGTVWVAPDRAVLDRTTLRKLDGGEVSQIIEYSKDGGTTWVKTYDATYRHSTPGAPPK